MPSVRISGSSQFNAIFGGHDSEWRSRCAYRLSEVVVVLGILNHHIDRKTRVACLVCYVKLSF